MISEFGIMFRRLIREFYLLARGEQRALLVLTALLILGILARLSLKWLPGQEPPGWEEFLRESEKIMVSFTTGESQVLPAAREDSLILHTGKDQGFDRPASPVSKAAPARSGNHPVDPASLISVQETGKIDINRADSAGLLPLPGIGPVFAGRIIRYRDLLGGFTGSGQLHDVYGLPPETVTEISSRLIFDLSAIRQINLHEASFSELLRHPYLEIADVKSLMRYIEYRGAISTVEEIRMNRLLADSTLEKISPYLDTGQ